MKPQIHVRPAVAEDFETIAGFNQAMAQETEGKQLDPHVVVAGVRKALCIESGCHYFMAELDHKLVGQIMFTTEWSDWRNGFFWWIQSVYVAADSRRRGVFRAMHHHVRELASNNPQVCGLRLYVHSDNAHAIETYKSLGMCVTQYRLCEEEWPRIPD